MVGSRGLEDHPNNSANNEKRAIARPPPRAALNVRAVSDHSTDVVSFVRKYGTAFFKYPSHSDPFTQRQISSDTGVGLEYPHSSQ